MVGAVRNLLDVLEVGEFGQCRLSPQIFQQDAQNAIMALDGMGSNVGY